MKPVLLVDVDGVLNAYAMGHNNYQRLGFRKVKVTIPATANSHSETYFLVVSDEQAKMLSSLRDDFDLVWCTSWNQWANEVISPLLSLPLFPVLELDVTVPQDYVNNLHWKTKQVAHAFSEGGAYSGRRFAWLDDETTKRDRTWFNTLFGKDFHKLVLVNPGLGFTKDQRDALLIWKDKALES